MVWFYLAGFISGAVGVILLIRWWAITHTVVVTKEELTAANAEKGERDHDRDGV